MPKPNVMVVICLDQKHDRKPAQKPKPTTTIKHRNFVSEPIKDKSVKKMPGIGEELGRRLIEAGFEKAYSVLGKFLSFHRNEKLFKDWLKEICNANPKQASDCYNSLKEWCENFM